MPPRPIVAETIAQEHLGTKAVRAKLSRSRFQRTWSARQVSQLEQCSQQISSLLRLRHYRLGVVKTEYFIGFGLHLVKGSSEDQIRNFLIGTLVESESIKYSSSLFGIGLRSNCCCDDVGTFD